jgi:hypothetical protein
MSNRAIWNVRLRHESLTKTHKGKRLKRRQKLRLGMNVTEKEPEAQAEAATEASDAS